MKGYYRYEEGNWSSQESWEEEMIDRLVTNLISPECVATISDEVERLWQLTGIEVCEGYINLLVYKGMKED